MMRAPRIPGPAAGSIRRPGSRPAPRAAASVPSLTRKTHPLAAAAVCIALAWAAPAARAQATLPTDFVDELVVGGLDQPVGMAFLPDGRLLFVEQARARIRLIVNGALAAVDPVVVVPNVRTIGPERGLLGIAVDPGFPARPYVYVHCNDSSSLIVRITRFTLGGDLGFTGDGSLTIATSTRRDVINNAPDVQANHNGGTVRFGPDGMLYASLGEDAAECAAQDTSGLRGVILRLDVSGIPSGGGAAPHRSLIAAPGNPFPNGGLNARLIWAFGLRNPFRFHIDPLDGVLYIGDVGEAAWEELDRAPSGGLDFGWPRFEGPDPRDAACALTLPATAPIHSYGHNAGVVIITAGPYRRPTGATRPFPGEYVGDVLISDYYNGFLRRLKGSGTSWAIADPVPGQPGADRWATGLENVSDYAVAPDGTLWYCRQSDGGIGATGQIRRIASTRVTAVEGAPASPRVSFARPYPSPARNTVRFSYMLAEAAETELVLLDLSGRLVRAIAPRALQAGGPHEHTWDGRDRDGRALPAGVYRAVLRAGGERVERRVTLVR